VCARHHHEVAVPDQPVALGKTATSCMQAFCDELVQQSEEARMNVNGCKTKQMMIGPISKDPLALWHTS